jgi:hypothetical protein
MIAALLTVLLAVPTPSPTLSPLPTTVVQWYADKGAAASGLDPALVRAIIDAESAGDPHAVSRAGAVGMMQLEPSAASDCGLHDRFDPGANVACGARTLSYLIRDFGLPGGIAAYKFGAGNVTAVGEHLRRMPTETQRYIGTVIERYDELQHVDLVAFAPTPVPTATPMTIALPSPAPTCDRKPAIFAAIGMQILDSLVVSNAVRHGSVGVAPFGSSSSPATYVGEHVLLDGIGFALTRRSCTASNATFGVLGASALLNSLETRWPK